MPPSAIAAQPAGGLFDRADKSPGVTIFHHQDHQNPDFAHPSKWLANADDNASTLSESTPDADAGASLEAWNKALELTKAKDWNGLLAHGQRWTQAEPENFVAYFALGHAYGGLERHDEAIAAYREALRINPEYIGAWYNLGNAYARLDR